jgi:RNA polymerase sigma-70 factor (ECF subfamily)
MVMTDQEALELCRRGRPEGFRDLVERYGRYLFTLALRILRDRSLAEDAVQEAFAAAFRHLGQYRGEARLKTWLYTILYRSALQVRERQRGERPMEEAAEVGVPGHAASVETRLDVREVLDQLPERDRVVLTLSYWDDLSGQEIADLLGTNPNHVKILLFRARERFARLWPAEREQGR